MTRSRPQVTNRVDRARSRHRAASARHGPRFEHPPGLAPEPLRHTPSRITTACHPEAAVLFPTVHLVPDEALDERDLRRMDNRELDLLFRSSPAGEIPTGRLPGTTLLF